MNRKTPKTFDEIDTEMRDTCFSKKIDQIPASIQIVSTCFDGKNETVVSRILEVDGKPFMGIDYADGKPVGAWTADARGHREPIEVKEDQVEQKEAARVLEKISATLLRVQEEKDVNKKAKKATQLIKKTKEVTRTAQVSQGRDFS